MERLQWVWLYLHQIKNPNMSLTNAFAQCLAFSGHVSKFLSYVILPFFMFDATSDATSEATSDECFDTRQWITSHFLWSCVKLTYLLRFGHTCLWITHHQSTNFLNGKSNTTEVWSHCILFMFPVDDCSEMWENLIFNFMEIYLFRNVRKSYFPFHGNILTSDLWYCKVLKSLDALIKQPSIDINLLSSFVRILIEITNLNKSSTNMEQSSQWLSYYHWEHWMLSKWRLLILPSLESLWQPFHGNVSGINISLA